ncbi:MAG: tetratricopeptide repeat protein [bacterium]
MNLPLLLNNININKVNTMDIKVKSNSSNIKTNIYPNKVFNKNDNTFKVNILKYLFTSKLERNFINSIKLINKNKYKEAKELLIDNKLKNNDIPDVEFLLALLSDNPDERLQYLNNIINNLDDYCNLFYKYKVNIYVDIIVLDEIVVRITNDIDGLYFIAAKTMYDNGMIDKAIDLISNTKNDNYFFKIILGELFIQNNEYKKSVETLQDKNIDYTFMEKYFMLLMGITLRKLKLYHSSIEILRKARRYTQKTISSLILESKYQLGISLEAVGKETLARKEYESILIKNISYKDINKRLKTLKIS